MTDPLADPDDPELLTPEAARLLAERVEQAQLQAGAVRYGRVGRVGCARVVLNPDSPLPGGCFAVGLDGRTAPLGPTLLALEQSFADSDRAEALLHASPTTVPEIEGLADEAGWFALTERLVCVALTAPPVDGTHEVLPADGDDVPDVAELLGDVVELPEQGEASLRTLLGHRLDDPRTVLLVVRDAELERAVGFALGRAGDGSAGSVGIVEHVAVRSSRRRRGIGSALLGTLTDLLLEESSLVAASVEEVGAEQGLVEACGFVAAYPVTTYARRLDELV